MTSPLNEANFEEISIVPDYRALQIILENKQELQQFLDGGDPIIRDICSEQSYKKFTNHLGNVESYLTKKCEKVQMTSEKAAAIGADLKKFFHLEKEEIVMILNQLPFNEAHLEMMFPGKFTKEQALIMIKLLNTFMGIPDDPEPSTSFKEEQVDTTVVVPVKEEI